MTSGLTMYDTIVNDQFPPGGQAYGAYVDGGIGDQPNYPYIVKTFSHAYHLSIALDPSRDADCLDIETGAASPADAPGWYARQKARGVDRPCLYASASVMNALVVPVITAARIARPEVRLWSAHYGAGEHICSPSACGMTLIPMDGTQWTDSALGRNLDQSLLLPDFFGTPKPPPVPQEEDMGYPLPLDLAHNTAIVLPVPPGKATVRLYADPGYGGGVQPEIRVGTAPRWNGGPVKTPTWGRPAEVPLPPGTTEITVGRDDTGHTPVTVDFA